MPVGRSHHLDGAYAPSLPGLVCPVACEMGFTATTAAPGADVLTGALCIVPMAGILKDLRVYDGATATGNVKGVVYADTPTTRAALFVGSAVANATSAWIALGDPDVRVYAGQAIYLCAAFSEGTTLIGGALLGGAAMADLPASFIPSPGAAENKLAFTIASSYTTPPNPITETNMVAAARVPAVIARVVSL